MKIKKIGNKYRLDYIADGVRHRVKFKTHAEADAELTRIKTEVTGGTYVDPNKIPAFEQLARDQWFANCLAISRTPGHGYRPSTLAQWQSHIERHLVPAFGKLRVNQIGAPQIHKAITQWGLAKKEGGHGLKPQTISKLLTTASRIFKKGMADRFLHRNPVELVERLKVQSGEQTEQGERLLDDTEVTERNVLTPEETKRVILATKPGLYRTIVSTAAYSGLRHSELLALKWSDLDLAERVMHVKRTISYARVKGEEHQGRYRWFDPKTRKGLRDVPMGLLLVNALTDWKAKCPKSKLELVFPTEAGEPCHRSNILRYGLYPALQQAEIEKNISMQSLRHTYASMLILLGRPVSTVSGYLGHADVAVTMRVYTHFLKPKKQDTMDDLEGLVQNS